MCMNNGALFPISVNGWVNKRTFTVGLQNVNPHSEMPDVLSEVFQDQKNNPQLHNLSDYTRLYPMLSRCQIPWFLSLNARLYRRIFKSPPPNHNAWMSRKPFLNLNPMAAPWETHTDKNIVQLTHKNPMNLGLVLSIPHSADRGRTLPGFLVRSHNNLPVADRCTFYWTY